jgi:hypothetical protein
VWVANNLWKPNWACTICGMLSSRRYSVQRHIGNVHQGLGFAVSYVEYMAGTLAGIYKPNSISSQRSKRNAKVDSLHMKNALKFSYSKPFTSSTQFDMYAQSYSHYYDEPNKVMKSSSAASSSSSPGLMTIMTTEFASELGRVLARNFLYPSQANKQSFNINAINKASRSLHPFPLVEGNEIFGYRFHICKDCLITNPLAICYPEDGKSGRIEYKHRCNPIHVAFNHEGIDKDSSVKTMYEKLPESMINFVNTWIKGKKALIAIELPKNNNDNTPEEIIKVKNPKRRQQLIIFQYSKELHIDITLTNENQNHWAIRAIKGGQTTLTGGDLMDFIRRVKDRTFAVVKVHMPLSTSSSEHQECIRLYFMAIISADDTSSYLPYNGNIYDNKSPLSANFADKTFPDFYNELANLPTSRLPASNERTDCQ